MTAGRSLLTLLRIAVTPRTTIAHNGFTVVENDTYRCWRLDGVSAIAVSARLGDCIASCSLRRSPRGRTELYRAGWWRAITALISAWRLPPRHTPFIYHIMLLRAVRASAGGRREPA